MLCDRLGCQVQAELIGHIQPIGDTDSIISFIVFVYGSCVIINPEVLSESIIAFQHYVKPFLHIADIGNLVKASRILCPGNRSFINLLFLYLIKCINISAASNTEPVRELILCFQKSDNIISGFIKLVIVYFPIRVAINTCSC